MQREVTIAEDSGATLHHRPSSLEQELAHLEGLDTAGLKAAWQQRFGTSPPALPSRLLLLAIAHDAQARAMGGLTATVRKRLRRMASGADGGTGQTAPPVRLKPGTTLLRDWDGRCWRVEVNADGTFSFAGTTWRSLSAIAREITGTSRNGPAFFGLKRRARS